MKSKLFKIGLFIFGIACFVLLTDQWLVSLPDDDCRCMNISAMQEGCYTSCLGHEGCEGVMSIWQCGYCVDQDCHVPFSVMCNDGFVDYNLIAVTPNCYNCYED